MTRLHPRLPQRHAPLLALAMFFAGYLLAEVTRWAP